mmetsp:Transcript_6410/g.9438  ORF Transcript_6410/g.9438 Transcript_6410/m.9438 type:complete len:97 (+) Transcript_6410:838-1128(+)
MKQYCQGLGRGNKSLSMRHQRLLELYLSVDAGLSAVVKVRELSVERVERRELWKMPPQTQSNRQSNSYGSRLGLVLPNKVDGLMLSSLANHQPVKP